MDNNLADILKNLIKLKKVSKPVKTLPEAHMQALHRLYGQGQPELPEEKAPDKSLLGGIVGDSIDFYK